MFICVKENTLYFGCKEFFSCLLSINGSIVVNMYTRVVKVAIKIFQGSAVTQTVFGGLTIIFSLQVSYSVYVRKIRKVGWQ